MPCLHFFCGKPGAGKTTLALQLAHSENAVLISEDIWMARLYGDQMHSFDDYIRLSQRLKTVVGPLVSDLLKVGQPVVMDFQANTRGLRQWFRGVFEPAGAEHVLHWLQTPDATCLARIAKRNLARPEGSHHLTEAVFHQVAAYFEAPQPEEGFHLRPHLAA